MRKSGKLGRVSLVVAAWLLGAGCSEKDTDKISKVGNKALNKAELIAGEAGKQIALSIGNAKSAIEGLELSGRVHYRLKWDRQMEGASVNVQADKGRITLEGSVRSNAQRRKANELARDTAGVEAVNDALQISAAP